jgi:4,5-DOPA dioxygenase extradiol
MNPKPPVLFVGHGSPMFALEPGAAGEALIELGRTLPTPHAVLMVSPHWETSTPTVSTASVLETIHDFGGFDSRLYDMQYTASGSDQAAHEVISALEGAGLSALTDDTRGLDHGAWVPLRYLLPSPQCPIVPLSIQHHGGAEYAYKVGQALAPLSDQGWMIVGSGNITHNLNDWREANRGNALETDYALEFSDWIHDKLINRNIEALLSYRQNQASAQRAQPRDEHLLPLFTALGAAGPDRQPSVIHRGIRDHVIAMDSYLFR